MLVAQVSPPDGTIYFVEPDSLGNGNSSMGGFVAVFVLFAIVGIGVAVYKIWWAGELARRRGHDPGEAMLTSFLAGDAGTAAAYMRADAPDRPESAPEPGSVESRLEELAELRRKGLISEAEAAAKRSDILRDL